VVHYFCSARISSRGKKTQSQSPKTTAPSGTQTLDKYLVSTGSSKRKQSWVQPPEEVRILYRTCLGVFHDRATWFCFYSIRR